MLMFVVTYLRAEVHGLKPEPGLRPGPKKLEKADLKPDEDEIINVLDLGGCDVIEHNKIAKRDLYSDHIWKVLDGLNPVVYNSTEFMLQTPRYPVEKMPNEPGIEEFEA
ncbi:hypothetical protein CTI12_AA379410 [Artemisia annua]|uniref:Uncharacterized protein n=1 Tax=Artemisia annua TaxID=35608 RepID=A0A2U1MHQ6_ARTAN|nr:hypothetical protein CTI12_AA379410 [Artemisia annua]